MTKMQVFTTAGSASVLGTLLGTFITAFFGFLPNVTNVDPKVTELAIAILQDEPHADQKPLRLWATNIIEKRATVKFSNDQKNALLEKTKLPKTQAPPQQAKGQ